MVERGGLENRCALTSTQGSNPCLSAIIPHDMAQDLFDTARWDQAVNTARKEIGGPDPQHLGQRRSSTTLLPLPVRFRA